MLVTSSLYSNTKWNSVSAMDVGISEMAEVLRPGEVEGGCSGGYERREAPSMRSSEFDS